MESPRVRRAASRTPIPLTLSKPEGGAHGHAKAKDSLQTPDGVKKRVLGGRDSSARRRAFCSVDMPENENVVAKAAKSSAIGNRSDRLRVREETPSRAQQRGSKFRRQPSRTADQP